MCCWLIVHHSTTDLFGPSAYKRSNSIPVSWDLKHGRELINFLGFKIKLMSSRPLQGRLYADKGDLRVHVPKLKDVTEGVDQEIAI